MDSTQIPAQQTDSFILSKYKVGPHYYPSVIVQSSTLSRVISLCSIITSCIKVVILVVVLAYTWNGNKLSFLGATYCLLLTSVIVFFPLYFVPVATHNDIPELIELENIKARLRSYFQAKLSWIDTVFLIPFVYGCYLYFGPLADTVYNESPLMFTVGYVYVIMGFCYIFSGALITIFTILCLPCLYLLLRYLNRRENIRLESMGASDDLIAAFPILKYKRKISEDIEMPAEQVLTQSEDLADAEKKRKFKFKLTLKTKKEDPNVHEPMKYLEMSEEDALCVICLQEYEEEEELRQLSCKHHFHVKCIDDWLHRNAKCPLCIQHL